MYVSTRACVAELGIPGRSEQHQSFRVRLDESGNADVAVMGNDSLVQMLAKKTEDGGAALRVFHRGATLEIGVDGSGEARITSKDADGKVLWRIPK